MVLSLLDPAGTFLIYCRMFRELPLEKNSQTCARDKVQANGILIGYPSYMVDKVTVGQKFSPGNSSSELKRSANVTFVRENRINSRGIV